MAHPYPPRWTDFSYAGRYRYALTFAVDGRRRAFADAEAVGLVLAQILRAAVETRFVVTAYCFMPDHLHLIAEGQTDEADCRAFIKLSKQYSGYYYKQASGERLWQRYLYDRVIREDRELALTVRYLLANPVRAGLVKHPSEYPFVGSQRYTVEELLAWSEYDKYGESSA